MNTTKWIKDYKFGTRKEDGQLIMLRAPSWDCEWYWGFGYLGNKNEHYHLSSYQEKSHYLKLHDGTHKYLTEKRNKNMHDCLLEDYELNKNIESNLWKFCELVSTIYTLKESAEVLGRGGSHYTTNTCKDIIINKLEVERINSIVLPSLFNELDTLLKGN